MSRVRRNSHVWLQNIVQRSLVNIRQDGRSPSPDIAAAHRGNALRWKDAEDIGFYSLLFSLSFRAARSHTECVLLRQSNERSVQGRCHCGHQVLAIVPGMPMLRFSV